MLEEKYQKRYRNVNDLLRLNYSDIETDDSTVAFPFYEELSHISEQYSQPEKIAEGGMKIIYRVWDNKSCRNVAKAVLKERGNLNARERFLREARIGASLQHPNILPIHDIDIDSSGEVFFIMELLEGQTLRDVIANHYSPDTTSSLSRFDLIDYFLKVCDAVSYAHSQGILHLDLKPDNIYVNNYRQIHLCDWGLSVRKDDLDCSLESEVLESYDDYMTLCGKVKGTPGYMAPEQYDEKGSHDERTDVFALGSILYTLLTGQPAIEGRTYDTISANTCNGAITPPSSAIKGTTLSASLEAVIMKALNCSKEDRYQSVDDLRLDLNKYLQGYATKAENPSALTLLRLLINRNRGLALTVMMALCTCVTLAVFFIVRIDNERRIAIEAKEESDQLRIVAEENLQRYKDQQRQTDAERIKNEELLINAPLSQNIVTLRRTIQRIRKALVTTKSEENRDKLINKKALIHFVLQSYNLAANEYKKLSVVEQPYSQFYECADRYKSSKLDGESMTHADFAELLFYLYWEGRDYVKVLYEVHLNKRANNNMINKVIDDPKDFVPLARYMLSYINGDGKTLLPPLKFTVDKGGRHLDLSHTHVNRLRISTFKGLNVLVYLKLTSLDLSYTQFNRVPELSGLRLERLNLTGCTFQHDRSRDISTLVQVIRGELIISKGAFSAAQLKQARKKFKVTEITE